MRYPAPIPLRFPPKLRADVERVRRRMQREEPDRVVTMADALRRLVRLGLDAARAERAA